MPTTLKEFLQDEPFGHPLHSALVHFPIGLFVFSLVLDLATNVVSGSNPLFLAAFYTMAFGLLMALIAALPGLVDWGNIRTDHPARKTATTHLLLNVGAVVLYLVNLLFRASQMEQTTTPLLYLGFSLVGVGIILVSGYLGGTLVYDNGIGVGRHRRRTPIRRISRKTVHVASKDAKNGYLVIGDAEQLQVAETLRVSCDETVMAVVKLGGRVYAFQEFCTHRYGPLSEGAFHDHQVECPWHRSCFDVRSGKVVQGPAKVDLKTFEVKIHEGKIILKV